MSKHEITPSSLVLAELVERIWPKMIPKGHAVGCPTRNTLALSFDALRTYGLIDHKHESMVLKVMARAQRNSMLADSDEIELSHIAQLSGEKLMAAVDEEVDGIIKQTTFANQGVPWEAPEMEYEDHDDNPYPAPERPEVFRHFVSAQAYLSAVDEEKNTNQNRGRFLHKMGGLAQKKRYVRVEDMTAYSINELALDMPNFSEVLDDIRIQIEAREKLGLTIKLQPILLVGKPGIGKTRFIKNLATALFCESHVFNLGGQGDILKLKGLSKGWGNARPGDIACKLAAGATFNPIMMLDEIDKSKAVGREQGHDLPGLLLSYLEHESNSAIEDDYIGLPMDLSGVNWFFAVNSIDDLPDYFLSRVDVYHVPDFTIEQKRDVIKSMFLDVSRKEFSGVVDELHEDAIGSMLGLESAREIRRALFRAIALCVGDGRIEVLPGDFKKKAAPPQRQSIGFV